MPAEETTAVKLELPLRFSVTLRPEHLRGAEVVPQLLNSFAHVDSLKAHRDILYTLLAELYNNALEHGLLLMDSSLKQSPEGFADYYTLRNQRLADLREGELVIQLSLQPGEGERPSRLRVRFTDSGPGFDAGAMMEGLEDSEDSFGRGISLVQSLCDKLTYSNGGRTVDLTYILD